MDIKTNHEKIDVKITKIINVRKKNKKREIESKKITANKKKREI